MKWLLPPAALLLFALTGLYLAPATWLDWVLQRYSHGILSVADARGRLWQGEGSLQALLPAGEVQNLAAVRWQLKPAALLAGRLHARFDALRDGQPILDVVLTPSAVEIRRARLRFPAAILNGYSKTLSGLDLSGQVILDSDGLELGRNDIRGTARLDWNGLSSSLTRVRPLGDYHVDLAGKGDEVTFQLSTRRGKLALSGAGNWGAATGATFTGKARPEPALEAELSPLLRMLGKQAAPGVYTIVLDQTTGFAGR